MTEEDSFMQIVRERLGALDFLESQNNDGLFFNSFMIAGETFYVDMRKKPMRMYGYKKVENDKDVALDQEYVDKMLEDVRRELSSIGCDLKQHGFEKMPEPKPKEKPETVTNIIKCTLEMDALEGLIKSVKETFREHPTLGEYNAILVTKQGNIELTIPRPEIKKSDQKTVDADFF